MIPNVTCPKCGNSIVRSDRFCSRCGIPIEWPSQQGSPPSSPKKETLKEKSSSCPACGQLNEPNVQYCISCGTLLQKKDPVPSSAPTAERSSTALSFFQSWKFTVLAAVVLIGVVLYFSMSRKGNPHAGATLSPGEESAIQEIEVLQKQVDGSPGDTASLLRLANLLQDVRFYTRAITTYQRYLTLVPQNADAWVDAGTSFFALSFEDTTRRIEYLASARQEIQKALSVAPKHQLGYFNLGIVELHSGNIEQAMDAFKKCVDLDPNSDAGKKAQQFMSQHPLNNPSQ